MYEMMIAICLAINIDGSKSNPCWMEGGDKIYMSAQECLAEAHPLELRIRDMMGEKTGEPVVVHANCFKSKVKS